MEKTEKLAEKMLADQPVTDLVHAVDEIFAKLGMGDPVFHNPSYNSNEAQKICGLTNTYLQPIRIGRKAVLGNMAMYYGRKVNLFPTAYELVDFNAASDILHFFEKRISNALMDYMSIHSGSHKLDLDLRAGTIVSSKIIGFNNEFKFIKKGQSLKYKNLRQIISFFVD